MDHANLASLRNPSLSHSSLSILEFVRETFWAGRLLLASTWTLSFLLLLAWLSVGRSSRAVEVGGGLAPAAAHYPPPPCWDWWCPGLSVLCLSCGLTESLVGQVESTVLGHSCWCLVLSQSHRHTYETVLFKFCLLITVPLCPVLVQIQIGLAEWHRAESHSSGSGLLCFEPGCVTWFLLTPLISFEIVSCSV